MTLKFGSIEWIAFTTSILLLTDLAILLNIPFLRQVLGFLFLTILPGLLILQVLKLNKIGTTEKIVLSVGLSISFLMFFGLLLSNLSLSLGHETPLATISLLISFNLAFILLAIIGYKQNKNLIFSLPKLDLSTSEKAFLSVPILFPALSIFGMHVMNTTGNNIILMFLYLLIPIYVAIVCFFNHKFQKRLYPVVIFSISISLLLIWMLRFSHIFGSDVHREYYFFQTILANLHWSIFGNTTLDACLSISLLPAIYQSILNVNAQEYLFRGIYASICSFGPLAVYAMAKRYIGELYAFLASFFFISQSTFLNAPVSPRTNVAIFFAALAVMAFFNDRIDLLKKRILFIVFMMSCIVSHYSTTYIFFFILLGTFVGIEILSKKYTFKKLISSTIVVLFFALIFFWYSQVTETAFLHGVGFIENTLTNLNKFFIEELRDPMITSLYNPELKHPILDKVNFAVTWSSFILIGIGVLTMIKRYKEMIAISNVKLKKPDFLKTKFEMEYLTMALACGGVLVVMVALPYVSRGYQIQRLYSLMVIILSVCFIIGGITLSKHFFFFTKHFLSKERTCAKKETLFAKQKAFTEKCYRNSFGKAFLSKKRFVLKEKQKEWKNGSQVRAYLIILLILIPYFMFQTDAIYPLFGHPTGSITLDPGGKKYALQIIHDQESCSAKWLKNYTEKNDIIYPTDFYGVDKLISQGVFSQSSINYYSFSKHRKINGYICLSYNNVVNDKFISSKGVVSRSDYADMFIGKNKIYDNGGSEIHR